MKHSDLGAEMRVSDRFGRIHFIERPHRELIEIKAHATGMLIAGRGPSLVKQGDCVTVIFHDTDPRTLP